MAISYPTDLLDGWPGVATLQLGYRQEIAPERGGQQNSADIGPALWELTAQSRELKPSDYRIWLARLHALENGAKTFKGYDRTACYPLAYPSGTWPTGISFNGLTAQIFDVDTTTNRHLRITGLPAAYQVSEGDFLSFEYDGGYVALHQAMETVVASGAGLTAMIEVRPHIRASADLEASPTPAIRLIKPYALMHLVPGSVQASQGLNGRGTISFQGRQTITAA